MFDFTNNKNAFGLEISDFSLKVMSLKKRKGNYYNVQGYNRIRLPKGLIAEGKIENEDSLASIISELLNSAKPQKITTSYVACSLPENKTFTSIIKVPKMNEKDLEEAIKWEAESHIPISIDSVYMDWQILPGNQEKNEMQILLAAAPNDLIDGYINTFKKAKINLLALEPCAVSKGRSLILNSDKENVYLIVDIGANKTVFDLLSLDRIYFSSSSFQVSGNLFTKSIVDSLGIKESEAENEKINCCSPKMSKKEMIILKTVHPILDNLASEIKKIEGYFHNNIDNQKEFQVLLCGGGASFFGIAPYLSLKTQKKIKLGNPWINIHLNKEVPLNHANSLIYAEVLGLALRGADIKNYMKK